jgi:putative oxidoreductase
VPIKKLFSARYTETSISFGLFLLRLAAGGLMIPHGYQKLQSFAARSAEFADPFGLGSPISMALVIFAEFFCGILIVIGLLTRLATIPLIITMAVVVFYSNKGQFILAKGDLPALFLACFLVLLITGPGKWSVDRLVGK